MSFQTHKEFMYHVNIEKNPNQTKPTYQPAKTNKQNPQPTKTQALKQPNIKNLLSSSLGYLFLFILYPTFVHTFLFYQRLYKY